MEQQRLFDDTRRLHPKWGYDLDKVPAVLCSRCREPIGDEEYVEDTMFARFGTMFFFHKRCATDEYMGRKPRKRKKGRSRQWEM